MNFIGAVFYFLGDIISAQGGRFTKKSPFSCIRTTDRVLYSKHLAYTPSGVFFQEKKVENMKARMVIALLLTILSSCTPTTTSLPSTKTLAPSSLTTRTPSPTSTFTSTSTTIPTTITPILETGLPPSPTITPNITQEKQQQDIKNIIQAYFELHYLSLSISPPADIQQNIFGELVSSGDDAKDFLITETAKLAVEKKWNELNKLRYAKYKYSLKYTDISFDATAQIATVSLHEYFEIICEGAMESNSQNPSACAIGELTHELILHNEDNQWKIISDTYWDSWWRQFRKPGLSPNEILQNINAKMQKLETMPSPIPE